LAIASYSEDGGPPAYWWLDHYPHLAAKNLGMVWGPSRVRVLGWGIPSGYVKIAIENGHL